MEKAPLTLAQNHVRNAVTATASSDVSTASAEHELAAQQFAEASKTTGDAEALRILTLLESQHHRLASIIKTPAARASVANSQDQQPDSVISPIRPRIASPGAPSARSASPAASTSSPSRLASRRRPSRDPASSIVNNLNNARGIPGAQPKRGLPAGATVSVANAVANAPSRVERQSRAEKQESPLSAKDAMQRQAKRAEDPKIEGSQKQSLSAENTQKAGSNQASEPATTTSEDRFHKFYSTFENVFSAISAPLAFASLPLGPSSTPAPPAPPAPNPAPAKAARSSSTTSEPDYTALISKPALRALREDPDRNGRFGGAAESFYVVPPSGGTVSYAGILAHPQGHLPDLIEESSSGRGSEHDEFVDAMETPYPPSPTAPRHMRRKTNPNTASKTPPSSIPAGRGAGRKTVEEIELENITLRALLDQQSRRLQMWEATSQSQSVALAASLRARAPAGMQSAVSDPSALAQAMKGTSAASSPTMRAGSAGTRTPPSKVKAGNGPQPIPDAASTTVTAATSDDASAAKIAELTQLLETQLQAAEQARKDQERTAAQNEKLRGVLGQYRQRWESLKSEARKRRHGSTQAAGTTTPIEEGVETSGVVETGDVKPEAKDDAGIGVGTPKEL